MADNFMQFSHVFEVNTRQEAWLRDALENCPDPDYAECANVDPEDLFSPPCEFEITERDTDRWEVWLSAGDTFDAERLVELLERFTKECGYDEVISFSWAYTCSKLRADEFGGGGVAIYKGLSKWIDVQDELTNSIGPDLKKGEYDHERTES